MASRVCVFGFVIIFICSPVFAVPNYIEACDAVFSPDATKMSCCDPMDHFVATIIQCRKESSCPDQLTCSAARCVLALFGVLSNDNKTLDESKLRPVFKKLIEEDPEWEPLLDEEERTCLNGQYKQYANDTACDLVKYLTCSYVSNYMGCPTFDDSPCFCKTLAKNVAICKPFLQEYLEQIMSCD